MKFVEAGKKGVNIKLSPACENKIFTDITEDGQDVVIVKGRIVRVDVTSPAMAQALVQPLYPSNDRSKAPFTLLVETDEAANWPNADDSAEILRRADRNKAVAQLAEGAARHGFTLTPVAPANTAEGETTDERGRVMAGQVAIKNSAVNSTEGNTDTGEVKTPAVDESGRTPKK
jgi:hypothetical protein